ncbi:protein kinase, partial [Candidatus Zixiibacteriota bacterium]
MMIGKSIGQYEILEKIGEGGMGEVYLAQDSTLDRKVALKFLRSDLQFDVTAKQRLIREAKAVAALNHPYICSIYGVCEENTEVYLVMELIEGETLQERLLKGAIPIREALRISVEITEALEKAHQNSIVHRDLKPSNIMLTP